MSGRRVGRRPIHDEQAVMDGAPRLAWRGRRRWGLVIMVLARRRWWRIVVVMVVMPASAEADRHDGRCYSGGQALAKIHGMRLLVLGPKMDTCAWMRNFVRDLPGS